MNGKLRKEQHLLENVFSIYNNNFFLLLFIILMEPLVNKSIHFLK